MSATRLPCQAENGAGKPCGAPPMHGSVFCFWHDPDHAAEASEARRVGGTRRRHERIVLGAHDIESLDSAGAIRRVLELALIDGLGLPNSSARPRVLIAVAAAAANLLQATELDEGLRTLKEALGSRTKKRTRHARS